MPFQKGKPKTGGRKKGVLNKETRNFLDFQLWFGKACRDHELIEDPEKRFRLSLEVIDKLMAKVQALPSSPQESRENAMAREAQIEALEKQKETEAANALNA